MQLLDTKGLLTCPPRSHGTVLNARPLFIIGVGRSGTTLLRLMLHHHPRIAIPYESHFIDRYAGGISRYGDLDIDDNLTSLVEALLNEPMLRLWDHEFQLSRTLARIQKRSLAGVLDAIYGEYAEARGKVRWGDKSDSMDGLPHISHAFPSAQFIHIVRDGRDVARSVLKLPWGPNDLIHAAEWWAEHVRLGCRMGAMLESDRYLQVRYEDLVQSPEQELRRICAFLGEEYSPLMLEYHNDADEAIPAQRLSQHYNVNEPPKVSRTCAWKTEMSKYGQALFVRYGGKMLRELGYEVPEMRVNSVVLGCRMAWEIARRYLRRSQPAPAR